MPKGKPPPDKQWKPGQSGNPEGARRHDPIKRRIKKLTTEELENILNSILLAHPNEINAVSQENPTILKTWVASIVTKAVKNGDSGFLLLLLDRLVGKVTDKLKVTSDIQANVTTVNEAQVRAALAKIESEF